ncbi:MAG: hypothetical protein V3W34_09745 [Phycisphaerae bacterium]
MTSGKSVAHRAAAGQQASWVSVAGLFAAGLTLVVHAWAYDFVSDDAFIVARYARNVVENHGWVYNIGEPVEGYTSFLWVALTAVLGFVGVNFVAAVRALSLVGGLGCLVVMYLAAPLLGIGRHSLLACLSPFLLAASGATACWSLGGLEACGYAAVILVALLLAGDEQADARRLTKAGVACGVCALLRPEGILTAMALTAWLVVARGRTAWRLILAFLIPIVIIVGSHLLWRHHYYGDWLPNTFYVKVGTSSAQIHRGLRYVLAFAKDHGGLLVWVIPFVAVWVLPRRPLARALSVVGAALVAGVIVVGGDGLPMYRFMVPVIPIWALLMQTVLAELLTQVRRLLPAQPARGGLALFGILVCAMVPLAVKPTRLAQYDLYDYQKRVEVPGWTAAGMWLARNAAADSSIACVPIGAVGYYSRLHVYDMTGLTDKHIAHLPVHTGSGWAGHEKHDGPYILSKKPTYLLLGNIQVTKQKIPSDHPYFVRPPIPAIQEREGDIFVPGLFRQYERKVAVLPGGRYFHFLQRRPTPNSRRPG